MTQPLDVAVAIVPRERWSLAVESLRSVLASLPPVAELIYLDGGSPDHIQAELESLVNEAGGQYLRRDHVVTSHEAHNIVVGQTSAAAIVFVENDVFVREGWLEAMHACAIETGAGAVTPLILMGSDEGAEMVHIAGGRIEIKDRVFHINDHTHEWASTADIPELERARTGQVEYHVFLVTREVLDTIGPADERVRAWGDHEDFVLGALSHGFELWFEPAAVVVFSQFRPLERYDFGAWQTRWSESWIIESRDRLSSKWDFRADVAWPEEAVRWSRQRRMYRYHGQSFAMHQLGRVLRKLVFFRPTSRITSVIEEALLGRPGRREMKRRAAAGLS